MAADKNINYDRTNLESFGLDQVLLTDHYYINATQKEIEYLLSIDPQRLLAGFYETAGIQKKGVMRYEGWESLLIGGHTIGHYLTACTNLFVSINSSQLQKKQLLSNITEIVYGLYECQKEIGTGFIFGATVIDKENIELQFDHVERKETDIFTQAWVPWYTMHKIFEGLISVASFNRTIMKSNILKKNILKQEKISQDELNQAELRQDELKNDELQYNEIEDVAKLALEIATQLGEWTYRKVMSWSIETLSTVLETEYGGMNDCLYDLFQLTGDKRFADAAHAFDQTELFEKICSAKDGEHILNNHHANTTIPKFAGALNRYISYLGDSTVDADIYLDYAKRFWDMVVNHHTYITGGNSEWEHFGLDDILDGERTNCNNETCNAYNMLKMTKKLFMLTGDAKYANYYENAFINSIMSSQNPETGMTTYFQPMATGYFKVFGERFTKFWCCTGSGMENFSKLGESFYFHKDNLLVVNQYISSELIWEEQGIKITQKSKIPVTNKVEILLSTIKANQNQKLNNNQELSNIQKLNNNQDLNNNQNINKNLNLNKNQIDQSYITNINIALRLPEWLASPATIVVNGVNYQYERILDYAYITGPFTEDIMIEITLPLKVRAIQLPDNKDVYGFQYGPVVLSALLGTSDMEESTTGVNVTIPLTKKIETKYTKDESDVINVHNVSVKEYIANIDEYLIRKDLAENLCFKLTNTDANLTFVPHFSQYKERYGIYWYFVNEEDKYTM